jgi:hypothetical protein
MKVRIPATTLEFWAAGEWDEEQLCNGHMPAVTGESWNPFAHISLARCSHMTTTGSKGNGKCSLSLYPIKKNQGFYYNGRRNTRYHGTTALSQKLSTVPSIWGVPKAGS